MFNKDIKLAKPSSGGTILAYSRLSTAKDISSKNKNNNNSYFIFERIYNLPGLQTTVNV